MHISTIRLPYEAPTAIVFALEEQHSILYTLSLSSDIDTELDEYIDYGEL